MDNYTDILTRDFLNSTCSHVGAPMWGHVGAHVRAGTRNILGCSPRPRVTMCHDVGVMNESQSKMNTVA